MSAELVAFLEDRIAEEASTAQAAIANGPEWVAEAEAYGAHPRRDLCDLETKRAILAAYSAIAEYSTDDGRVMPRPGIDIEGAERIEHELEILEPLIYSMAAAYTGHPDYRQEWRP